MSARARARVHVCVCLTPPILPLAALTTDTACINGVLDCSDALTQLTSAPWASASAMTGKFCRAAERYSSAPGWRPLRSSSASERSSFGLRDVLGTLLG